MSLHFCNNCGYGNNYEINKPSKCGKCSKDFNKVEASVPHQRPVVRKPARHVEPEPEVEEDDDTIEIPTNLTTADVFIEDLPNHQNKVRLGDVMGSGGIELERARPAKVSPKKFMERFSTENGARQISQKSHRVKRG